MNVSTQQLIALQTHTERIRNLCILAHVDHGKTTLSDHLIGSNGLIHPKLMGEMRYMDSRDDEQARGITMKSSSISLLYVPGAAKLPGGPNSCSLEDKQNRGILVNLIDSPGHVDFCSEVSSAARLSDGALVIIDAVEGVCIQTHAVMRQAWEEKVKVTLVINKMDRLVLELQLTPEQAYERIKAIVAQANMIVSGFQSEKFMSEADAVLATQEATAQAAARQEEEMEEESSEEETEFSPEKGNVIFASAHDGWAFSTEQFAGMYAAKMGIKPERLAGIMWSDWAYDAKSKRVIKIKRANNQKLKPLFVQLALAPLWKAYEAAIVGTDAAGILKKIVSGLHLSQVTEKMLSHPEPRKALRQVLQAWLPLADAVLGMAVAQLPNPIQAARERVKRLLPAQISEGNPHAPGIRQGTEEIQTAVQNCSTSAEAPLMVYVSKMVAVPAAGLPRNPGDPAPLSEEVFLAFGRLFSGQIREGQTVHILSAAYDPSDPGRHRQEAEVSGLYMMMGRGLERLAQVQAGNVVAIGGLESVILKSATLSSTPAASPIAPMMFQASPIVRVAVEPSDPTQMPTLVTGLRLLNRADPFVEVAVQESGEHVIGAAGMVHLDMCIKDLKERFARIDIQVSEPLVAFRESAFYSPEAPEVPAKPSKVVEGRTANGSCVIRVRARALPRSFASALDDQEALLHRVLAARSQEAGEQPLETEGCEPGEAVPDSIRGQVAESALEALQSRLQETSRDLDSDLTGSLQRTWLLGPHHSGPNILLASTPSSTQCLFGVPDGEVVLLTKRPGLSGGSEIGQDPGAEQGSQETTLDVSLGSAGTASLLGLLPKATSEQARAGAPDDVSGLGYMRANIESGVAAGFQIATANGPLCDEPMWGVVFEVQARLRVVDGQCSRASLSEAIYGPVSGQVTSVAKQAFRRALLEADPRLVEAMFLCEVSTTAEALSGTYAVLGQRRARVLREELREGSDLFSIHAFLPVEASFGLADDMRRRSSGAASVSLMRSHWERLQVDPFFAPTTEEEREEFGEEGQGMGAPNFANAIIARVRRRKGLPVDKKVVESSTKQRTRAKKV